jgi:hypothetical protein
MKTTQKKLGCSYALQPIYEYLPQTQQLTLQLLRKRIYRELAPALFSPLPTFTRKGFKLTRGAPYIQLFSPTLQKWQNLQVT